MKALIIGQGGREHALVKALKRSQAISEVHVAPGSDGIALDAKTHKIDINDFESVRRIVSENSIDFVVIGPEGPLVAGLSDFLRSSGINVVGPSQIAAQLEGSKIFCKEFFLEAGIPTARSFTVSSVDQALSAATHFSPPYVLKADGLAAGKGVFICKTRQELQSAAHSLFVERSLGASGSRALLEEFSPGYEISYLILTNGESFAAFPLAQDHKRLLDGDEGPNTGGMGVVAPIAIDRNLRARIDSEVVQPTLDLMRKRKMLYRGVLFIGLMMTKDGPSVLEFNTRFGDPETQAVLPLLDGDWGIILRDLSLGKLSSSLKWKSAASCCIVLAAAGYPDAPLKGAAIETNDGEIFKAEDDCYVLHAGTAKDSAGNWTTNGGRVLNSVAIATTLNEAIQKAYRRARALKIVGIQMRSDIGEKVLAVTNSSVG